MIEETGPEADALLLGEGVGTGMVRLQRRNNDLVVDLSGPHGSVTVKDWFSSSSKRVESIQFADGTTWGVQQIRDRTQQHHDDDDDHHGEGHHDGGDHGGNGHDDDDDHHGGHDGDSKDKHDDDKRHHSYAWARSAALRLRGAARTPRERHWRLVEGRVGPPLGGGVELRQR